MQIGKKIATLVVKFFRAIFDVWFNAPSGQGRQSMNPFMYKIIGWGVGALIVAVLLLVQAYKDKYDK